MRCMYVEDEEHGASRSEEFQRLAREFHDAYVAYLKPATYRVRHVNGREEEVQGYELDEDLLLRKLFGQEPDPHLRLLFSRCIAALGVNPEEILALGERAFQAKVERELARTAAFAAAMSRVDERYGPILEVAFRSQERVLQEFRRLLGQITLMNDSVPEVIFIGLEPAVALDDVEAALGRGIPPGQDLPEYVCRIWGRRYLTPSGLALFGLDYVRRWLFEDAGNERIETIHSALVDLQYALLTSTPEGRKALDNMLGSLFGGEPLTPP